MAYKYAKGKVFRGDIYNEDDAQGNTYIDWDEDYIGMVASGSTTLVVSGSAVGIGTTSPQMSLEILDPTGQLRLSENDTDNATLSHRLGKFTISVCGGGGDPMVVQAGAVGVVDGGYGLTPTAMFHASSSYDDVSLLRLDAATSAGILFVTGSGKVGINTTTPQADLHISSSGDEVLFRVDGNTPDTPVIFVTGSGNEGRIGFGTATPEYTFDLVQSEGGSPYEMRIKSTAGHVQLDLDAASGGSSDPRLYFRIAGAQKWLIKSEQDDDTLRFIDANAGHNVVFTQDGEVGIGTTSPQAQLHVSSSADDALLQIDGATDGTILFVTGSGADYVSVTGGAVGIGVGSNPRYKLEIGAGNSVYPAINITGSHTATEGRATMGFGIGDGSGFIAGRGAITGENDFYIYDAGRSEYVLVIYRDGGTGLGNWIGNGEVPDTYTLEIASGGTAAKPSGGSWTNSSSDRRLKQNIINVTGSLTKIKLLQGRTYEWINPQYHGDITSATGFIAQEVQAIFPEFVSEGRLRDEEKDLIPSGSALTYGLPDAFSAHLVEAIKEQQVIIESLEARIEQLEISGSQ